RSPLAFSPLLCRLLSLPRPCGGGTGGEALHWCGPVFDRSTRGSLFRGPLPRTGGGVRSSSCVVTSDDVGRWCPWGRLPDAVRVITLSRVSCVVLPHYKGVVTVRTYSKGSGPLLPGNRSLHGVLLGARRTAADAEAVDQRTEALDVLLGEVLQQPAALADEDQQTTAGVVVVLVGLEVLRQVGDATGQQGDL